LFVYRRGFEGLRGRTHTRLVQWGPSAGRIENDAEGRLKTPSGDELVEREEWREKGATEEKHKRKRLKMHARTRSARPKAEEVRAWNMG
jgi:hypothetical protein